MTKEHLKWPDTTPPLPDDGFFGWVHNGTPYKKTEVAPGKWQWTVDQDAIDREAKWQKEKRDLYWALRSRVLTDEEMGRVEKMGIELLPQTVGRKKRNRELNNALLQQFKLRVAAAATNPPQ